MRPLFIFKPDKIFFQQPKAKHSFLRIKSSAFFDRTRKPEFPIFPDPEIEEQPMSRRSAWLIGVGVGAVALGGAVYLLWRYTEEEEDERSGVGARYLLSYCLSSTFDLGL